LGLWGGVGVFFLFLKRLEGRKRGGGGGGGGGGGSGNATPVDIQM